MNVENFIQAGPLIGCLFLIVCFLIAGLVVLARTRRTLAWFGMAFGTLLVLCSLGTGLHILSLEEVRPAGLKSFYIEIAAFFSGLLFGAVFFFTSFLSHAFSADRILRRVRELEYLCGNISAEMTSGPFAETFHE